MTITAVSARFQTARSCSSRSVPAAKAGGNESFYVAPLWQCSGAEWAHRFRSSSFAGVYGTAAGTLATTRKQLQFLPRKPKGADGDQQERSRSNSVRLMEDET